MQNSNLKKILILLEAAILRTFFFLPVSVTSGKNESKICLISHLCLFFDLLKCEL